MKIVERAYAEKDLRALIAGGMHPVLARVYAGRQIRSASELDYELSGLIAPGALKGIDAAAALLADAIAQQKRLLIVADYDADGATACAVGMRALRAMGAKVEYLVPDRFKLGYGLTPELVDVAALRKPDLLITVDNGIASVAGVARAKALGITLGVHGAAMQAAARMPLRQIADSGIVFGLGTDATIVSHYSPFVTLGWVVSGLDVGGNKVLDQTLTREEALIAHTRSNAYLFFQEKNLGSLEVGKQADLVVLDRDYMTVPAADIKRIKSRMTMVGGRVVFESAPR